MSEKTGISWCDATFNPSRTSGTYWKQPLRWERKHEQFYAEHGHRRRVFCASLADVFDNEVSPQWRADLFDVIRQTPHLDWLLLTKRIGNVNAMLPDDWGIGWPHVWLGITVVNQEEADRDIEKLLAISAVLRFVSLEPLLEPIRLRRLIGKTNYSPWESPYLDALTGKRNFYGGEKTQMYAPLDWVICGGESGSNARPIEYVWIEDIKQDCGTARTPFFFKQWGGQGKDKGGCFILGEEHKAWPQSRVL